MNAPRPLVLVSVDRSDSIQLPVDRSRLCPCGQHCDGSRWIGDTAVCDECAPRPRENVASSTIDRLDAAVLARRERDREFALIASELNAGDIEELTSAIAAERRMDVHVTHNWGRVSARKLSRRSLAEIKTRHIAGQSSAPMEVRPTDLGREFFQWVVSTMNAQVAS